ncbi:MAG: hypothetical protein M3Q59_08645 [Actinomycetota bacterium]|nr:hypothetical protein [Actinomycetota bacterium]
MDELWARSRSGSHAGRGFHYQDAVATELALCAWRGELDLLRLIPEGLEDVSLELANHRLHLQAKSRRTHRGDFSASELADAWRHLAERLVADPSAHVGLVLERPFVVETGVELTLADVASASVRKSIAAFVADFVEAADFLARAPRRGYASRADDRGRAARRTPLHCASELHGPLRDSPDASRRSRRRERHPRCPRTGGADRRRHRPAARRGQRVDRPLCPRRGGAVGSLRAGRLQDGRR